MIPSVVILLLCGIVPASDKKMNGKPGFYSCNEGQVETKQPCISRSSGLLRMGVMGHGRG